MSVPSVTVVVLNYDGLEHLEPCFESLREVDYPADALELMLVDNGSTDASVAFMRSTFPDVNVVETGTNLGFAAGSNLGARRSEAEYLIFLNNDMRVDPRFVRELVAAVSGDDAVACAGAKILDWTGETFDFAGGWLNASGHGGQRGLGEPFMEGRYDEPGPTGYACGGAMIVAREIFLDTGGFDEEYFAVFEDVDFGWRLRLYGHEVGYAPAAVAYHRQHGTLARASRDTRSARERRNALATIFKNYDDVNMPGAVAATVLAATTGVVESAGLDGRLARRAGLSDMVEGSFLSGDEVATLIGLADLVDLLPGLQEKRAEVQRRRVRSDLELAPFFRPYVPHRPVASLVARSAAYAAFGVDELSSETPRKVLVFSPDILPMPGLPTVGSGLRAWGLGQGLRSRGHEVVFSMPRDGLESIRDRYEIPPDVEAFAWTPFEMNEIVDLVEPDVVLVCGWAIAQCLMMEPLRAVPVVLDQHGPHMLERQYQEIGTEPMYIRMKRTALASADYFTCAGNTQLGYFQDWLAKAGWTEQERRDRSFAMRFSLSPDLPERAPRERLTFVYGGVWLPWLDPTAGLLALVDQLERRGTGRLRLFGGKHPWITIDGGVFEELTARLEASPHVVHEGQVTHAELIEQYRRADVAIDLMTRNPERELAVTSRTVEYLWCGLPVIYNDYSELSELIREYDAGWTVDPEDPAAIERALDEAFEDPEAVRRKGENARRLVLEQLNWAETIEPLDRVVRSATRRTGARPIRPPKVAEPHVPSLSEKVRGTYRTDGAIGVAGIGVRGAARKLHLDHPRNGREPTLLQKTVWVSLNHGPREALRKVVRRDPTSAE